MKKNSRRNSQIKMQLFRALSLELFGKWYIDIILLFSLLATPIQIALFLSEYIYHYVRSESKKQGPIFIQDRDNSVLNDASLLLLIIVGIAQVEV